MSRSVPDIQEENFDAEVELVEDDGDGNIFDMRYEYRL